MCEVATLEHTGQSKEFPLLRGSSRQPTMPRYRIEAHGLPSRDWDVRLGAAIDERTETEQY